MLLVLPFVVSVEVVVVAGIVNVVLHVLFFLFCGIAYRLRRKAARILKIFNSGIKRLSRASNFEDNRNRNIMAGGTPDSFSYVVQIVGDGGDRIITGRAFTLPKFLVIIIILATIAFPGSIPLCHIYGRMLLLFLRLIHVFYTIILLHLFVRVFMVSRQVFHRDQRVRTKRVMISAPDRYQFVDEELTREGRGRPLRIYSQGEGCSL